VRSVKHRFLVLELWGGDYVAASNLLLVLTISLVPFIDSFK